MSIKRGQLIKLNFEGRDFEVIVIDPHGLGKEQPTVGFGYGMMDRHGGLPQSTSSTWSHRENEKLWLESPSGKSFEVIEIPGVDGNNYSVIEVSDWVAIAADAAKAKGKKKVSEATRNKLIDFLSWFAVKGFYADAYTALKGVYTAKDSRVLSAWMEARLAGKRKRNKYTDFLQGQGCENYDYAFWTDYVYQGLFGMYAWQMRQFWKLMEGDSSIGRNYIPEVEGLEAVAYCENQVVELFHANLQQAHDDAIAFAQKKFNLPRQYQ